MPNIQGFLLQALEIYEIIILARVLLSWIQGPHPQGQISVFLHAVTDPLLRPIQNLMRNLGPLDFSPIVAILLLELLKTAILRLNLF